MRKSSCRPSTTTTSPSSSIAAPPCQAAPSASAASSTATRIRLTRLLTGWPRSLSSAEAAPPAGEVGERLRQVGAPEVRPQRVREDPLGVGDLPQHEVRHAPLAGRADDRARARQAGVGQALVQRLLVDVLAPHAVGHEPPRGLHELGPPAVVEADVEVERLVLG